MSRNTLVCDTQDEAKRLAFGTERHKVLSSCACCTPSCILNHNNMHTWHARALCKAGRQEAICELMQVVSLDGTLISKGGVMTGGMSRNLESRAQRWDEKTAGSLKEVRSSAEVPFCSQDSAATSELQCTKLHRVTEPTVVAIHGGVQCGASDLCPAVSITHMCKTNYV